MTFEVVRLDVGQKFISLTSATLEQSCLLHGHLIWLSASAKETRGRKKQINFIFAMSEERGDWRFSKSKTLKLGRGRSAFVNVGVNGKFVLVDND